MWKIEIPFIAVDFSRKEEIDQDDLIAFVYGGNPRVTKNSHYPRVHLSNLLSDFVASDEVERVETVDYNSGSWSMVHEVIGYHIVCRTLQGARWFILRCPGASYVR